jgi:hypothetical protein
MRRIFCERAQKTPLTHLVIRVTLSDLYQSGDPNVNKQVLKNVPGAKKENARFRENISECSLLF